MPSPSDYSAYKDLHPSIRCVALVGQFLQDWAGLEASLGRAIQNSFSLSPVQAVIITKNIQLRDKLNIIKTVLTLAFPAEEAKRHKKTITEIADFSLERNMLAHDQFYADGKDVKFFVAKAKGNFELLDTRWSIDDFERRCADIIRYMNIVESWLPALRRFAALSRSLTPKPESEPMNALLALALEDRQSHQPPALPHSAPAPSKPRRSRGKTQALRKK